MSVTSQTQTCRLAVVGPQRQVDVSVPCGVALVDLVPALLAHVGPDLADRGLEHGGWVVQRLGEAPLDEELTPEELGLLDGDVLHLRPRSDTLPPIDFDDLVDGVATGMRHRPGLWRTEFTRRATAATIALLLLAALTVVLLPGDAIVRAANAWGACLALLLVPAVRSAGRTPRLEQVVVGLAAVTFAGVAAVLIPGAAAGVGMTPTSAWVLAGGAAGAAALVVAMTVLGPTRAVSMSLFAVCLWGLAGVSVLVVTGRLMAAAAAVACLASVARPLVPRVAFRLCGLMLDTLPSSADDLQEGIDPEPGPRVLEAAAQVDASMTALYAGTALPGLVCAVLLLGSRDWSGPVAVSVLAAAQLLALRPLTSAWHRFALGGPAVAGLLGAVLVTASRLDDGLRWLVVAAVFAAAGLVAWSGGLLAERRMSPVPGRIGDWMLTLAGAAAIPCCLWAAGAYPVLRNAVS